MKLTLHYHWPLRGKNVQTSKHIPFVEGEKLNEAINEFLDEAMKYVETAGFGMEIKIEEDAGR